MFWIDFSFSARFPAGGSQSLQEYQYFSISAGGSSGPLRARRLDNLRSTIRDGWPARGVCVVWVWGPAGVPFESLGFACKPLELRANPKRSATLAGGGVFWVRHVVPLPLPPRKCGTVQTDRAPGAFCTKTNIAT